MKKNKETKTRFNRSSKFRVNLFAYHFCNYLTIVEKIIQIIEILPLNKGIKFEDSVSQILNILSIIIPYTQQKIKIFN